MEVLKSLINKDSRNKGEIKLSQEIDPCYGCSTIKQNCVLRALEKQENCPCSQCLIKPMCNIPCRDRIIAYEIVSSNSNTFKYCSSVVNYLTNKRGRTE
jgi:hypothetical protein